MKVLKYLAIVLAGFFLFIGCKKELSFENGLPLTVAEGTLKDSLGNCMAITTYGSYVKNTALTDSNYIIIRVNFTTPGSYRISTDTSNGFSFQASGSTADSGLQMITLKGMGKPAAIQLTNFLVTFDSTVCTFSINVSDSAIVPPTTSNDYFPATDSSNWTYRIDTVESGNDSITAVVYPVDQVLAGNTYRTFVLNKQGIADTSYYRKGDGLYYQYGNFNDFSFYTAVDNKVDFIFLKDNVPTGSTWESPEIVATLASIAGKTKIRFTIEGKDIQTTIGSVTFDSVIQVQREYLFAPSATGAYQTAITANFYYAKNIGFIKADLTDPFAATLYVSRWQIFY